MPGWKGSTRRASLPPNWGSEIRPMVLRRDGHRCTHIRSDDTRCPRRATDVDHLDDRDDHRPENLAAKCGWHHQRKSSAEGGRAAAARRIPRARPPEPHPGLKG